MPSRFPLILLLQFCLRTKKWRVDLYPHFIGGEKTSSVTMTNGKYSSQESALKTAWKFLKIAYYASGVEVATVSRWELHNHANLWNCTNGTGRSRLRRLLTSRIVYFIFIKSLTRSRRGQRCAWLFNVLLVINTQGCVLVTLLDTRLNLGRRFLFTHVNCRRPSDSDRRKFNLVILAGYVSSTVDGFCMIETRCNSIP